MKVLVLFASHRIGGKNEEIEKAMRQYEDIFDFDFIHLAEYKIAGCVSCHRCAIAGHCVLPPTNEDQFEEVYQKMIKTDAIFIISPVYAPIPSRLVALFERLTSVLFDTSVINTDKNPLLNKKAAIFSYCSSGVCDDSSLKLIFDKFVMINYRFDSTTYQYLNQVSNPQMQYSDITDYIMDTLQELGNSRE